MKIITNQTWLAQDLFDLVHLFIQESKLDEEKPFVYFDMSLKGLDLTKDIKIEFDDNKIEFIETSQIKRYQNELEQKRYIKRSVKKTLYELLSKKFNKTLALFQKIIYTIIVQKYGELAERSKAAVLKTVDVRASWGSNP